MKTETKKKPKRFKPLPVTITMTLKRWKEFKRLESLLRNIAMLNNGSLFIDHVQAAMKEAKGLTDHHWDADYLPLIPWLHSEIIKAAEARGKTTNATELSGESPMIADNDLKSLIAQARDRGAVIRVHVEPDGTICRVQVRNGAPGIGPGWMPPIAAAERLREFIVTAAMTPKPPTGE